MGVGACDDHTGADEAFFGEEDVADACGFSRGNHVEEVAVLPVGEFDHLLVHGDRTFIGSDVVDLDEVVGNEDDFVRIPNGGVGAEVLVKEVGYRASDRIV